MHFCVMFYSLDKVKLEDLGNEKKDPICTWVIDVKQGIVWGLPANLSLENIQDQIGRTDVAVGGMPFFFSYQLCTITFYDDDPIS